MDNTTAPSPPTARAAPRAPDFTIESEADVFAWCDALHLAGQSFHLDDAIVNEDGESEYSCFTDAEAAKISVLRDRAFEVMGDPHAASIWSLKKHYNDDAEMWEDLDDLQQPLLNIIAGSVTRLDDLEVRGLITRDMSKGRGCMIETIATTLLGWRLAQYGRAQS